MLKTLGAILKHSVAQLTKQFGFVRPCTCMMYTVMIHSVQT